MKIHNPLKGRLLAALISLVIALPQLSAIPVWINEIDYDNLGTDTDEFIELAGVAGTILSDYSLALYNGNGGADYRSITFSVSDTISNLSNGFGVFTINLPSNGIQNGAPDGIALLFNANVLQFLSYEGSFTALSGPATGTTSIDIGVSETNSNAASHSLQLVGTGSKYSDFTWSAAENRSPGSINAGQTFTAENVPDNASSMMLFLIGIGGLLTLKRWSLKRGLL